MYTYNRLNTSPPTQLSNVNIIIEKNIIIKNYKKVIIVYNIIFILLGIFLMYRYYYNYAFHTFINNSN